MYFSIFFSLPFNHLKENHKSKIPAIRSKNLSVCSSMNKNGNILFKGELGEFNTKVFRSFIEEMLSGLKIYN